MTRVKTFERTMHTADRWVGDVAKQTGDSNAEAYAAIRAVLHTLRDRLPHNESAHLAAQLPLVLRGTYYEGWRPSDMPQHYRDADEFLQRVAQEGHLPGNSEASAATRATMGVLGYNVEVGEIDDVLAVLPPPIRSLLEDAPAR